MTEFPLKAFPKKRTGAALALLVAALALASCKTAPVVIPPDLDAPTLILKAQEASDGGNYSLSLRYYKALIDNWGSDPSNLATGKYEIAFIAYKQGDKAKAKELFTELLALYDAPGGSAFPDRYKVLAQKLLAELQ